jgi:hypothetical protein
MLGGGWWVLGIGCWVLGVGCLVGVCWAFVGRWALGECVCVGCWVVGGGC